MSLREQKLCALPEVVVWHSGSALVSVNEINLYVGPG